MILVIRLAEWNRVWESERETAQSCCVLIFARSEAHSTSLGDLCSRDGVSWNDTEPSWARTRVAGFRA